MSATIECIRHRFSSDNTPSYDQLEQSAAKLREIWWHTVRQHPLLDVGIFRLDDPRKQSQKIELTTEWYQQWLEALKKQHRNPGSFRDEYAAFVTFVNRKKYSPHTRILVLHIPPRSEVRSIAADVRLSMYQLAGWIEAHNYYYPDAPVNMIMGRTSLNIDKRARDYGFETVTKFPINTHIGQREQNAIIEHLVQNPHLRAKNLFNPPVSFVLTDRNTFNRSQGINRQKCHIKTRNGYTVTLPHQGNGWQLWLTHEADSQPISNQDAHLLRGAMQVAAAEAHQARRTIRMRIPDPDGFSPYLQGIPRTAGIWEVRARLGTPVISYGYPPKDMTGAFLPNT